MELDFSDDQEALRDAARQVLAGEATATLTRALVERGEQPRKLWAHMCELGWPGIAVPDADGGVGLGAVEAAILAEELGRALAPGPLLSAATQYVPAILECAAPEQRARLLEPVTHGKSRGTVAVAEASGSFDPANTRATLAPAGSGYVLDARKCFVVDATGADEIVVVARAPGTTGDDGVTAVVVPAAHATITPVRSFDRSRDIATVTFDAVDVPAERVLPRASAPTLRRAFEFATVALALETVGVCQAIFDVTLEYAKQREQFGVPIGSFQAIKHKFADLLVALERARATGYFAALTIAEDDPRRTIATSVAKAAASDCQRLHGKEGIQIHGGIGYTWEHDMHLYVKRAKTNDALFGNGGEHRAAIADALGV